MESFLKREGQALADTGFPALFQRERELPHFLVVLLILALHISFFLLFYGKFGDLVVDSPREATVPWRILEGQTLYKDFHYEYGPLSPYFFALLYRVFGVHLLVLQIVGLGMSVLVSALVYAIGNIWMDRIFSLMAALVFIFVFAFQHYFSNNNFNYIFPYSYAATFGTSLLRGIFYTGRRLLEMRKSGPLFSLAALFSGACLTKLEIAFAATVFVSTLFFLSMFRERGSHSGFAEKAGGARDFCFFFITTAGVLLPVLGYFVYRANGAGFIKNEIWPLIHGNFKSPWSARFFGTDDLKKNILIILRTCAIYGSLTGIYYALDRIFTTKACFFDVRRFGGLCRFAGISAVALACAGVAFRTMGKWNVFKALNVCMAFLILWGVFRLWREGRSQGFSPGSIFLFSTALASFTLLGRKFFKLDATHYGFYMLVPASILCFATLFEFVPSILVKFKSRGFFHRMGFSFFCMLVVCFHFSASLHGYQKHQNSLRTNRGTLVLPEDEYRAVKALLDYFPRGLNREKLLVIPEGAFINFFLDSVPLSYYSAVTPDFVNTPEKEKFVIEDIRAKNFKYIFLNTRWTAEFGYPMVGRDYFKEGADYIRRNYHAKAVFGAVPFNETGTFGILMLERNES